MRQFRAVASPEAFELARYVAFLQAPSLPVIQHIHQAMFRRVSPAHLAEVLLSGLLQLRDAKVGAFEFVPEVPRLLLDSLTTNEALVVGRLLEAMVSDSVEARIGLAGKHFSALTMGAGTQMIANPDVPFAVISGAGSLRLQLAAHRFDGDRQYLARLPPPTDAPGPEATDLETWHQIGRELLAPRSAAARFVGREAELATLLAWCDGEGPPVRLLNGRPGVGKTRLVQEAMRSVERLPLVIDNADQFSTEALQAQIGAAAADDRRVLLVARFAGEWWEEQRYRGVRGLIRPAIIETLTSLRLGTLAPSVVEFTESVCQRVGVGFPSLRLANLDRIMTPLNAQLQALGEVAAKTSSPAVSAVASSAAASTLASHQRYWERAAAARRLSYRSADDLDEYIAAAALYGADWPTQAVDVCRALRDNDDDSAQRIAAWIHDLYPAKTYWDLTGTDEVTETLIVQLGQRLRNVVRILPGLIQPQQASALWTLTRLAARHKQPAEAAWQAIREDPALITLVWRASDSIGQFPAAMLDAIRQTVVQPQTSIPVLDAIVAGLSDQALLFRGCDVATAEKLLTSCRRLAEAMPAHQLAFASALGHLATIRAVAGRSNSVAAAEEGVLLRRRLLEGAQSDRADQRAALDSALSDLAEYQLRFGLVSRAADSAEEALAGFIRSGGTEADPVGHIRRIAQHGRLLSRQGRTTSARSALESAAAGYRRLSRLDPALNMPRLASAVVELASFYRLTGNASLALEASSEAAALYTKLSQGNAARYRLRHADALLRLGVDLGESGSHANAQACIVDAINLYRLPADGSAEDRGNGIALAHYVQALYHSDLGHWDDAIEALDTAIAEYGELAAGSRIHRQTLALILTHHAELVKGAGRLDDAVSSLGDAAAIYQQIQTAEPLNTETAQRLALCLEKLARWVADRHPESADT